MMVAIIIIIIVVIIITTTPPPHQHLVVLGLLAGGLSQRADAAGGGVHGRRLGARREHQLELVLERLHQRHAPEDRIIEVLPGLQQAKIQGSVRERKSLVGRGLVVHIVGGV
jgi:hypothetical protein